jgi:N-acetylmuramoyl-L-alanine amidase
MKIMSRRKSKFPALLFVFLLLVALLSAGIGYAFQASADETDAADYESVQVYIDDLLSSRAHRYNGTTYVSIRNLNEAINPMKNGGESSASVQEEVSGSVYTAHFSDFDVTHELGTDFVIANGRYLQMDSSCITMGDSILFPMSVVAKIYGFQYTEESGGAVQISTEGMQWIESGSSFYDENDLYILSHIIEAEAGAEPFIGKVAVGNVVMNRVHSSRFADTIEDVVFAPGQFDPVASGGYYSVSPSNDSVRAACYALEGYNYVGDSVYFLNPYVSSSTWGMSNPIYIGNHVFFE